jgi:predicted glutamine amidotransferase
VKPAGIAFPSMKTMRNCFDNNSDGAGFMYASNGKVKIYKGIMSWTKYETMYKKLVETISPSIPFVFHFRIGTHGQKKAGPFCHPFPVSMVPAELKKTKIECSIGMAHNGIIGTLAYDTGMSDTMEFDAGILAPMLLRNYRLDDDIVNDIIQPILGKSNKLAVLYADGMIETYGDYIQKDGMLYSNSTYSYASTWKTYTDVDYLPVMQKADSCLSVKSCKNADISCLECYEYSHYETKYKKSLDTDY